MSLLESCLQRLVQPISIYSCQHFTQFRLIELPFFNCFAAVCIKSALQLCIYLLSCIHQVIPGHIRSFNTKFPTISHPNPSRFGSLAFDNNYSICRTRTINSRSCRIFQHNDGSNTVGIHISKCLYTDFKSVHDKQRLIGIGLIFALNCQHIITGRI